MSNKKNKKLELSEREASALLCAMYNYREHLDSQRDEYGILQKRKYEATNLRKKIEKFTFGFNKED